MIIISMPALVAKSAIETLVSKINRIGRNRSILSHLLRLSDTHPLLIGGSTCRSNATIIRSRTAVPLIVAISRELLTILKPWFLEEILRNLVNNGWIKTYLSSSNASKQAPLRDFKSILLAIQRLLLSAEETIEKESKIGFKIADHIWHLAVIVPTMMGITFRRLRAQRCFVGLCRT